MITQIALNPKTTWGVFTDVTAVCSSQVAPQTREIRLVEKTQLDNTHATDERYLCPLNHTLCIVGRYARTEKGTKSLHCGDQLSASSATRTHLCWQSYVRSVKAGKGLRKAGLGQ